MTRNFLTWFQLPTPYQILYSGGDGVTHLYNAISKQKYYIPQLENDASKI